VGDPAQSSWPDVSEATRARDEALGGKTRRRFYLPINYRNPAEIFAVAAAVIDRDVAPGSLPRAVRVTGISPVLRTVAAGELPAATTGRSGLYVAFSRATHRLTVLDTDPSWQPQSGR